jgi:hypothetical protein
MYAPRNIAMILGLWLAGTLTCTAQPIDTTDYRRVDSSQVAGSGVSWYYKEALMRVHAQIKYPIPIWLSRETDYEGTRHYERAAYDRVLHSYELALGGGELPDRVEFQIQDSTYQLIFFYAGTTIPRSVGRIRKYFGQYGGSACIDQEDTTFTARERQCVVRPNDLSSRVDPSQPCNAPLGEWLHYWPNGSLQSKGQYYPKDFEATYFENSDDWTLMVYSRDTKVKTGKWDYFDESGQLIRTVHYDPIWLNSPNSR